MTLNAWSDAKQQIIPEMLKIIYENLNFREKLDQHPQAMSELDSFRQKVNLVDAQLIKLMADRFQIIKQIGEYKREKNLSIYQPNRWQDVMESRIRAGANKGMTEKFMKNLLFAIYEESVKKQEAQLKEVPTSSKV